jgi:hypothetical protein
MGRKVDFKVGVLRFIYVKVLVYSRVSAERHKYDENKVLVGWLLGGRPGYRRLDGSFVVEFGIGGVWG